MTLQLTLTCYKGAPFKKKTHPNMKIESQQKKINKAMKV